MPNTINEIIESYKEAREVGTTKANDNLRKAERENKYNLRDLSLKIFGITTYTLYAPIIGTYDYLTKGPRDKETGLRQKIN